MKIVKYTLDPNNPKPLSKNALARIDAISDDDIDYSDIPELDENFFKQAKLHMPEPKKGIYIRLDADILEWLKSQGKGYQTRMNAMLRTIMEHDSHIHK